MGVKKNIVDKKKLFFGVEGLNKPKMTPNTVTKLIRPPRIEETKAPSKLEVSTKKINLPLPIAPAQRIAIGSKTEKEELPESKEQLGLLQRMHFILRETYLAVKKVATIINRTLKKDLGPMNIFSRIMCLE